MPAGTPGLTVNAHGVQKIQVIKREEKGSDVNLASYLLVDGWKGGYDTACILSNDGDLATPIDIVQRELGKSVRVVNPRNQDPTPALRAVCQDCRRLRTKTLRESQLPTILTDAHGRTIGKPANW